MKNLLIILALIICQSLQATTYYINQSSGSYHSAQDVNNLQGVLKAGDSVLFASGQDFPGTLNITRGGVHYGSYGHSSPLPSLNGWQTPGGWTQTGTNRWTSQSMTGAPTNLRAVVMNNTMMRKARTPNTGYYSNNTYNGRTSNTNSAFSGHNYAGGEIAIRRNHWIIDVNNIGSQSGNTVYYSGDVDGITPTNKTGGVKGNPYQAPVGAWGCFIQNHPDCVDQVGEYYWNKSTKQITVFSTTNPGSSVVIAFRSTVLNVAASGVTFNNITFEGANDQAVTGSGSNITFTDCTIRYCYEGAMMGSGSTNVFNRVKVLYTLNKAIQLPSQNGLINASLIDYSGYMAGMGGSGDGQYFAVRVGGDPAISGTTIQNSEVAHCGYVGIAINGNNTIVQNNYIHDHCFIKDDGGGVYGYNLGKIVHSGRIVRNNIIINAIGAPEGTNTSNRDAFNIYFDGGTDHVEVYGNTLAFAGMASLFINSANNINPHDNTFYGNKSAGIRYQVVNSDYPMVNNIISGNIFVGAKGSGQSGINFSTSPSVSWGTANFNHYASDNGKVVSVPSRGGLTLAEWRGVVGWDANATYKAVTTDILFIYNPTGTSKTVSLGGKTYVDIFNLAYNNGYFTLPPYASRVLFNTPNVAVDPNAPPPPSPPQDPEVDPSPPPAGYKDPMIMSAGDIAHGLQATVTTANLIINGNPDYALPLGDNAYEDGTLTEYKIKYDPTWGKFKAKTKPVPGNHEYHTSGGSGYYDYFNGVGTATGIAGDRGKGYYSYDLGYWHIIALNSEIGMASGSAQHTWLGSDLAANTGKPILAYWHKPRFNSGAEHGNETSTGPLWDLLYAAHADIILNGHEHLYERFAQQNPAGQADANGIRQFTVGTGGAPLYVFGTVKANSQVRFNSCWGVLKLTLRANAYDWQFIPASGTCSDQGTQAVHNVSDNPQPPGPMPGVYRARQKFVIIKAP